MTSVFRGSFGPWVNVVFAHSMAPQTCVLWTFRYIINIFRICSSVCIIIRQIYSIFICSVMLKKLREFTILIIRLSEKMVRVLDKIVIIYALFWSLYRGGVQNYLEVSETNTCTAVNYRLQNSQLQIAEHMQPSLYAARVGVYVMESIRSRL